MGNICGTSGSHYVYSPPVSPRHVSGSSTPVHSVGGQGLTSVYQLSAEARDDFLDRFDPMRNLGLNSHDSAHEWQGVFSTDRKQLGAYLLARYLDGREVSESHAQSLAEASETLKDTRDALSFGRGNVDADLELTQGESGQRVAASRVVNQRLKESGAKLGTSHTVAMAELVKAGLCSEHGDVAVHRHIPKLKTGEQIHKIAAPRSDHGWAELRRPGSPKENAIVIDAWAEGGPILAEDGSYTHRHISDDARVSRYAYGPALGRRALASLEKSRAQLSNIAVSVESARSELSDNGYWPESERIWSPEPVIESGFAQRVQAQCEDSKNAERNWSAAMRIARQLGSPEETLEKNARSLLELASDLRQVPQNARRPNV
ncbi:hypothetical protein BV349_05437 [Pseudomonas syringae pv. actinidiae]|nr:hypothetical protein BV349_05437 [Pseudomonas syringae pv. actinidiae]OSN67094.1 hypothetical protein BV351_05474 [Pseudomonas syringae pv. actinidiae]RMS19264.1 hypothetical protein ALP75_200578 [Pseudomonas syringae pv. actinidiae]